MSAYTNQVSHSSLQRNGAVKGKRRADSNVHHSNTRVSVSHALLTPSSLPIQPANNYVRPRVPTTMPEMKNQQGLRIAHRDANGYFCEPAISRELRSIKPTELDITPSSRPNKNGTSTPTSTRRKSSLTSIVDSVKRRLSLTMLRPAQRRQSLLELEQAHSDSIETHRQLHPETRPQYQVDYLLAHGAVDKSARDAHLADDERELARIARRDERKLKRYLQTQGINVTTITDGSIDPATLEAMAQPGRSKDANPSPTSTLSGKEMSAHDRNEALYWANTQRYRDDPCGLGPKPRDPDAFKLPVADRLAVAFGEQVVDRVYPPWRRVKLERRGSDDSGFGFSDEAPSGSMEACECCGYEGEVLKKGKCPACR
ncbi:hypothetical protein MBLNU230_g5943t1 [Neophaeotheca triangularis]